MDGVKYLGCMMCKRLRMVRVGWNRIGWVVLWCIANATEWIVDGIDSWRNGMGWDGYTICRLPNQAGWNRTHIWTLVSDRANTYGHT
jgi:hypothetical protein